MGASDKMKWTTVASQCVRRSVKMSKLQEGSKYVFRVRAKNEYGYGDWAELADPVAVSDVASAPGKVTVVDSNAKEVTLNWTEPENDGGCKIIKYIILYQEVTEETWHVATESTTTSAVISSGLEEGKKYYFQVKAVNAKGESDGTVTAKAVAAVDIIEQPSFDISEKSTNVT